MEMCLLWCFLFSPTIIVMITLQWKKKFIRWLFKFYLLINLFNVLVNDGSSGNRRRLWNTRRRKTCIGISEIKNKHWIWIIKVQYFIVSSVNNISKEEFEVSNLKIRPHDVTVRNLSNFIMFFYPICFCRKRYSPHLVHRWLTYPNLLTLTIYFD